MAKKYWYEVFEGTSEGTRTLATCNSLPEAVKTRKKMLRSGGWLATELLIDKWTAKSLLIDKWKMDKTGLPTPISKRR